MNRMTEAEREWLQATQPILMLAHLGERASRRKLLLFGCAAIRRVWHLLTHKHGRRAVETVERFADGLTSSQAVTLAAGKAGWQIQYAVGDSRLALAAARDLADAQRHRDLWSSIRGAASGILTIDFSSEAVAQARFLHDIFSDPFQPVNFDPRWRYETTVALAGGIYAGGAFDRMPILADALEDVGCDDRAILDHCRGPGPHVKGCWVVDLILGKE